VCDALQQAIHPRRPSAEDGLIRRGDRKAQELAMNVIPKRDESDSSRFGQARAALEHFQGLMRHHLRALVLPMNHTRRLAEASSRAFGRQPRRQP
jgi:hypothetical protein